MEAPHQEKRPRHHPASPSGILGAGTSLLRGGNGILPYQNETLSYTGDQLLALARLHSRQVLYAAYPDAVLLTRKEDFSAEGNQFHYRVCYTLAADICQENAKTAED